jgi:hypothetical protein
LGFELSEKNWGPGVGKAYLGLANTWAPNLDNFLPGKKHMIRVNFFEKKIIFCEKGDEIRAIDGTVVRFTSSS